MVIHAYKSTMLVILSLFCPYTEVTVINCYGQDCPCGSDLCFDQDCSLDLYQKHISIVHGVHIQWNCHLNVYQWRGYLWKLWREMENIFFKFLPFVAFDIIQNNDYKMFTGKKKIVHMVVKSKQQLLVKLVSISVYFVSESHITQPLFVLVGQVTTARN
jgi:hypothetical protein